MLGYVGECFARWSALAQYGDGRTEGYAYIPATGDPFITSALDFVVQGQQPDFWVPAAPNDCSIQAARLLQRR